MNKNIDLLKSTKEEINKTIHKIFDDFKDNISKNKVITKNFLFKNINTDITKVHYYNNNIDMFSEYVATTLDNTYEFNQVCIVIDAFIYNNYELFAEDNKKALSISQHLHFLGYTVSQVVINTYKDNKTFDSAMDIFDVLSENNFSKKDIIIAIGGGSIGDLAGFVSSTYKRGLPLIHIPTTLLSMVDSCFGGKNALNFNGIKNVIGTVYNPMQIFISPIFIETLSPEEIRSGFGEIIKYNFLVKNSLFPILLNIANNNKLQETLMSNNPLKMTSYLCSNLLSIINLCLYIKYNFIISDIYDKDYRHFLNLGHTIGHCIESVRNFDIPHGIAILFGILTTMKISVNLSNMNKRSIDDLLFLIETLHVQSISYNIKDITKYLYNDKKRNNYNINMILFDENTVPIQKNISISDIVNYLAKNNI